MAAFQRHWVTPGAVVITKQGPKVALLSPPQNKEPPLRGGVHLKTVAIVEPAKGKRGTSAGWLVSAADVGDDGSEKPRLQAVEARSKDQGAHGSGYGQPGPEGGSDQAHGAVSAPGSHMGGPGVRGPVPVKRQ